MKSNNKIVIFGYPRSGTKLLSAIYEQQNYFRFGAFFDTFTSDIVIHENGLPCTQRRDISLQKKEQVDRLHVTGIEKDDIKRTELSKDRVELFLPHKDIPNTIVTVYPENFNYIPNLHDILKDRYFLCARRSNKFEQLLSNFISWDNLNYYDEVESKPVYVTKVTAEWFTEKLLEAEKMQDNIVESGYGRYIDFDKLILGTEDLGFEYSVTSNDHNKNLESLIKNLDQVKEVISKYINIS